MPWNCSLRSSLAGVVALAVLLITHPAPAQEPSAEDPIGALRAELASLRSEYSERLVALEAKIATLEAAPAAAPAPLAEIPAAEPSLQTWAVAPAATQVSTYFNPAISLVGDFVAAAGESGPDELASSQLRESELGLQAIIDPYARADFFLAFSE